MFKKLLRYDMASVAKLWWIGAAASLGAGALGGVLMRIGIQIMNTYTEDALLQILAILSFLGSLLCLAVLAISFAMSCVLVFARYYKHFFTDEGYLTFTLPVSRSTLFLSKTVNALLWFALHSLVSYISIFLFGILFEPKWFLSVMQDFWGFIPAAWKELGAWTIVYLIELLALFAVNLFLLVSQIHFCITFGSVIAKKAKLIASIGLYYAFSSVLSLLLELGIYIVTLFIVPGALALMENATKTQVGAAWALMLLLITGVIGAIAFALYSITQHMLDRKLNLA